MLRPLLAVIYLIKSAILTIRSSNLSEKEVVATMEEDNDSLKTAALNLIKEVIKTQQTQNQIQLTVLNHCSRVLNAQQIT